MPPRRRRPASSDGVGLLSAALSHFASGAAADGSAAAGSAAAVGAAAAAAAQPPYAGLPPRALACTHFHDLARPAVLPHSPQLGFFEMAVLVAPKEAAGGDGEEEQGAEEGGGNGGGLNGGGSGGGSGAPVFLYRLRRGHSGPSFGLHCARACGLPEPLLARAAAVIAAQARGGNGGANGGGVRRLALPPLEARDARYRALARRLAAADLGEPRRVAALLLAAAEAAAGGGGRA